MSVQAATDAEGTGGVGQRWGGGGLDRASRFGVASASGPRAEALAARGFTPTQHRSAGQALPWWSAGWRPSPAQVRRTDREPVRTGRRGRPPLRWPEALSRTQTIKQRDERGRLLPGETRPTFGAPVAQPALVPVERRNGVCRDRLTALTRKTHALAKTATTGDALRDLHVFEQNWLHPHPALRQSVGVAGRAYDLRPPAMALHLTDHVWTWREFLLTPSPVSS